MATVRCRPGEPLEKALRVLKKKIDKEKVLQTHRKQQFAAKPSIAKREKSKEARRKARR